MVDTEVELPVKVQRMIEMICYEQFQPPPDDDARKVLASIGQENSIHMLTLISQKRIKTFSGLIKHMFKYYIPKPTASAFLRATPKGQGRCSLGVALTPLKRPSSSLLGSDGLIFHSPFPNHLLRSPSSGSDKKNALITIGGSPSTVVQRTSFPVPAHLLASPSSCSGNVYTPPRKRLKFSPHVNKLREKTSTVSKQWQILSELEFRRIFLVLNYIGRKKLEDVVSEEDAYKILQMRGYPMERFESQLWTMYGHFSFAGTESIDRRKFLDWECGKTYHYHCHVWRDGSFSFKGPYLETTKTLLHRTLGDENILIVKFEEQARGGSAFIFGDHDTFYGKVSKEGILIGQRRYRFFVFKDGERKGKKNSPITSDVKCYFIRMELIAPCNVKDPFNLLNKTMHEARCLFMHLHTTPSMAKYASRCSLILSQTIKAEINLDTVHIERIEDIPCQNENGINVCNEDGDLLIHTDGTGFISEDLAMKCPRALLCARYRKDKNSEMEYGSLERKLADAYVKEPPLLMQCRLFYNGCAVKGTFLVNRKLPPGTIQVRPSMVKVEADPHFKGAMSVNSLEVVNISRKPGKSRLSKYLIALLYFGGVPEQFFLKILADALEDSQRLFSDKRSAVRASVNHGTIDDDFTTARIILSGVPLDEPCAQHRLSHLAYSERKGLREGRLPISESYFLMGTADPTGLLNSDEVCVILDNGQLSGKVLVYRYPGLHFGDVHVLNAVYLKELEDIVGNAKYGIFFSTKGQRSVASEIANGDFDGDMYWVSKNNQLLHYFKESTPWSRMHSSPNAIHRKPSDFPCEELEHELFKLFLNTKNQNVSMGVAADSWMAFTDKFLTLDDNSNEKNNLKKKMLKLIDIYYDALDAPKSGKEVKVPKQYRADLYPHYMGKGNGYHSSSVLGKICDTVDTYVTERMSTFEIRKLPLFELVQIPDAKLKFWEENYDNYRQEMSAALSSQIQTEMNPAEDVINKYKKILYGAADFEQRSRNIDEIHVDALALYHVCYDFAKIKGDVSKCNFAWKIAGPALCNFHALNSSERSMFNCLPSVLGELI
ncbi:RNA-dependent RNA polymerase [Heracleum sosnowskyi]|uniref:RNA-dependent RNA polymerase n=1 Tax=Heracleum sosnowskyi TaxID=360622 RepID=A0AAD8H3E3_9APIA|nr:RNA-dependent RNA polymerase [Heracleum sosnowskyi]